MLKYCIVWFTCLAMILDCSEKPRVEMPVPPPPKYTGDLEALRPHDNLRVIVRPDPIAFMPRNAEPVSIDREIAHGLAEVLGLKLEVVVAADYGRMVEMLTEGEGDIIAAGMTITDSRQEQVLFSVPYLYVDELLVTARSDSVPDALEDLDGREIAVRRGSSYSETLKGLQADMPGIRIRDLEETLNTEEIVEKVSQGVYPATITDSNYWAAIGSYFDNLTTPIVLSEDRPVALAMRRDSPVLKEKVDAYLFVHTLTRHHERVHKDDLAGMKERGRLRMITRNNAMTYFIHRGRQIGFEYELMKRYAEQQNLRLEIVIPPSHEEMITFLNEGRGDIIAAAMSNTAERANQVAFTDRYMDVEEVVVVRADGVAIEDVDDLAGKTVHVRESSAFYETLTTLQQSLDSLTVVTVPEDMETEDILAAVDSGEYDVTVCDSNLLRVEQAYGRNLKAAFTVKSAQLGWAVRNDAAGFLASLNEFIAKEHRGLYYNMIRKRYFQNKRNIGRALDSLRSDISGLISPYDETVKKYADRFDLDWRLIVAQMYHESKFDPNAESWVGAQGLMQVMPGTARELGVTDVTRPEQGIKAGVTYLRRMLDRFDPGIPLESRIRFALAAYNAGYGHVLDARRLASQSGLDPNRWFENVEVGMGMLEKPQFYKNARYGYCRGSEPVHYVRLIQDRYEAYVAVLNTASQ